MNIRRPIAWLSIVIALAMSQPAFAQQMDVIRGRVIGADSQPVAGVTVRATSYAGNVVKSAKTDKNDRYNITYPNGEGDYWLDFAAIGYLAKRFELKRVADEEILLADTRLASSIATLEQVNVTANAQRALSNRNEQSANVGGGEKALSRRADSVCGCQGRCDHPHARCRVSSWAGRYPGELHRTGNDTDRTKPRADTGHDAAGNDRGASHEEAG